MAHLEPVTAADVQHMQGLAQRLTATRPDLVNSNAALGEPAEACQGIRRTAPYRGDLHIVVEVADGTMAASMIMWLDEVNRTAEFEPVGTHPDHRCLGPARGMLLHGMHLARAAGPGRWRSPVSVRRGILGRAGCITASGSGS
ncbi:hypothetical protein ACFVH0_27390 [Streptomyces sp. NPDC127117]|uniref:hypothetical protein n=1 Tax=Streptomyces sp. NPDC127117 TaxID=3345368 RepID=UPI0036280FBD